MQLRRAAALATGMLLSASEPQVLPSSFECKAEAGYYDDIAQVQPGPDYRIAGRVSANALFSDGEWYPVATARVHDARRRESISVKLRRLLANSPIELVVQTKVKGKDREAVVATLQKGEFASFLIEISGDTVRVEAGGRKFLAKSRIGPGATVQIACSTGRFGFDRLEWTPGAAGLPS